MNRRQVPEGYQSMLVAVREMNEREAIEQAVARRAAVQGAVDQQFASSRAGLGQVEEALAALESRYGAPASAVLDPAKVKPRRDMSSLERAQVGATGAALAGDALPPAMGAGGYQAPPSAAFAPQPRMSVAQSKELIKAGLADKSIPRSAVTEGFMEGMPIYQQEGRAHLGGYFVNPLEEEGQLSIMRQLRSAPLGGWVRRNLEGKEVFGHTISKGQARGFEQAAAWGIGGATMIAAIEGLNNPQTPGTIPMY